MNKPIIEIQDNGPYEISGKFQLIDDVGNQYETESHISLCRCGRSGEKPFCDGTHEDIGFESAPRAIKLQVEV